MEQKKGKERKRKRERNGILVFRILVQAWKKLGHYRKKLPKITLSILKIQPQTIILKFSNSVVPRNHSKFSLNTAPQTIILKFCCV